MYERIYNNSNQPMQEFLIFLFGLSNTITQMELFSFLSQRYRSILDIKMKSKDKDGKITGYAFLSLGSQEEYEDILSINKFYLHGRFFFAKPYLKGEDLKKFKNQVKKKRVFVIGIPFSFKNDDVRSLMSQFGPLEDAFVVKDERQGGTSKGYGYATFRKVEDAERVKAMERIHLGNYTIKFVEFMKKEEQLLDKLKREKAGIFSGGISPAGSYRKPDTDFILQSGIHDGGIFYPNQNYNNNLAGLMSNINSTEFSGGNSINQIPSESLQNSNMGINYQVQINEIQQRNKNYDSNMNFHSNSNQIYEGFRGEELPHHARGYSRKRRITRRNKDRIRVFTVGGLFIKGMDFNHSPDNIRMNKCKEKEVW